jgi:hypothetical protein
VYGIDATALLPVLSPAAHRSTYGSQHASTAEQRYRRLLAGVQLTKDFFFSYTWSAVQMGDMAHAGFFSWCCVVSALDMPVHAAMEALVLKCLVSKALPLSLPHPSCRPIHQTVQKTFAEGRALADGDTSVAAAAYDTKFVWNEFLSRPLRQAVGSGRWCVPLAHGFFQQRTLALLGRNLHLTLIARRSRQVCMWGVGGLVGRGVLRGRCDALRLLVACAICLQLVLV